MKPGIKIRGDTQLLAELKNTTQRVERSAREFMKRSAERVVKYARLNAPVDLHNLEESIHIERTYEEGKGRLKINVVAGGVIDGVNVDEYAAKVHENYNEEHPGEGTLEKRLANPDRHVGGKFLERAVEEEEEGLEARMLSSVTKEIKK